MRLFAACLVAALIIPLLGQSAFAQDEPWYDRDPIPQAMTAEEELRRHEIGLGFRSTAPPEGAVRNIAEFERNEAVLIRYPLGIPLALVAAMSEHVTVITIVSGQFQQNQATSAYQGAGVNMLNAQFLHAPTNTIWTRDYGPFYIADENHQVSIVDFNYNRPRPADNQVPTALASHLDIPRYAMSITHTGGNYMSTGWGAAASTDLIIEENLIIVSQDTLWTQTVELVNETMYEYLNIDPYHVTIDPMDPDGIKHIDTWAKFLDVDKVLIAEVPPSDPRYSDYELVADYFATEISAWGTPYQVFRVYAPQGQPYTNSIIVNERVYVPLMNSSWDAAALAAYEEAMPGYEVLGFTGPWLSNDAIHCRVKEVADRQMLYMEHHPLTGTHPFQPEFDLEVDIIPYSGADLITEEMHLIYRSGTAPFDTLSLAHVDGSTFSASIPIGEGDEEISYYFSAADATGRAATWPLIGPEGARSFTVDHGTVSTEPGAATAGVEIEAVFPNPAMGPMTVRYRLDAASSVRIEVFDVMGRRVLGLDEGAKSAGRHFVSIDTRQLSAGLYFYRLLADGVEVTERFVVAR